LLGGDALPEREWDHANSHKQKKVKGASKKMGFNGGVNLFFHESAFECEAGRGSPHRLVSSSIDRE
jgi:hypothetical protein